MDASQAEPVRLVVWDLDETFWNGTLSEGGHTYRRDVHDIVVELARRGIVSSICSKNDQAPVQEILQREGIWDYFVFPSINWEPKGQRLAALLEAVQLRAPTVMFIDDNPMNLAEAQHYVPGIQTRSDAFIGQMLTDPAFRGKDDASLSRLQQYRLLQQRQAEERKFGADNTEFLRASGLRVTIEHDLEPHLDRAIELINRTNQLNYTKERLPENPDEARTALRALLAGFDVQAGILRVRDNYGDYGWCGLYITKTGGGWKKLLQFCFSCRILNMGVETWLFNRLGRPQMKVVGEVLTNLGRDKRVIDWVEVETGGAAVEGPAGAHTVDTFYARGGCDLLAVSHYFSLTARQVFGEYNATRDGANLRLEHSMFARYGLSGISRQARQALQLFGHRDADFDSVIPGIPKDGSGLWLLSFWADADYALYRHRATGVLAPLSVTGVRTNMRDLIALPDAESGAEPAFLRSLREEFEYAGLISEADFKTNLRLLLAAAPAGTQVFILQMNESLARPGKPPGVSLKRQKINMWVEQVATEFRQVRLIRIADFVVREEEMITGSHFDRMVYFRIYQHLSTYAELEAA